MLSVGAGHLQKQADAIKPLGITTSGEITNSQPNESYCAECISGVEKGYHLVHSLEFNEGIVEERLAG